MCYHELYIFEGCGHVSYSQSPVQRAPSCPKKAKISYRRTIAYSQTQRDQNLRHLAQQVAASQPSKLGSCHQTPRDTVSNLPSQSRERSDSDNSNMSSNDSDKSHTHSNSDTNFDSGYGSRTVSARNSNQVDCLKKTSHPLYTFRVDALCVACEIQRRHNLALIEAHIVSEKVSTGMLRRKSNAIRHGATPFLKADYRYLYHSDDTREEALQAQGKESSTDSSRPAPISHMPSGRRDRRRRVTGYIDPVTSDKCTIIPLLAGTQLNDHQVMPELNDKLQSPVKEKPLPPVPPRSPDPHLCIPESEPGSRTSISSGLSAKIDAVEQTWRSLTFDNVHRDVLGRNTKGMQRIMGWQSSQTEQRTYRIPKAIDGIADREEMPRMERHASTGELRSVAV